MDEIAKRLTETSAQCLASLEKWTKDKKDSEARGALNESVHELRKVASRLGIEMAVSERDEMTQNRIPVPSHRDSRKRGDSNGNRSHDDSDNQGQGHNKPRNNSRRGPKKAAAGGGEG